MEEDKLKIEEAKWAVVAEAVGLLWKPLTSLSQAKQVKWQDQANQRKDSRCPLSKELSEQATATKSRPSPGSMTDDEDEVDITETTMEKRDVQ